MDSLWQFLCICLLLCSLGLAFGADKNCNQGTDCIYNQCCVLDKSLNVGVCQPMGGIAANCYVNQPYAYTRPVPMVTDFDRCPCSPGNICGAINSYDSVYGQKGICSFGK